MAAKKKALRVPVEEPNPEPRRPKRNRPAPSPDPSVRREVLLEVKAAMRRQANDDFRRWLEEQIVQA